MSDEPRTDGPDPELQAHSPTSEPPTPAPDPEPAAEDAGLDALPEHLRNRPDRPRAVNAQARSQNRLIMLLMFGLIPLIVVFVVVLNSLGTGPPDPSANGANSTLNEVTRYCVYTAPNDSAYNTCLDRTDPRVIQREHSNAARYARGQLMRCLSDATGYRCTLR